MIVNLIKNERNFTNLFFLDFIKSIFFRYKNTKLGNKLYLDYFQASNSYLAHYPAMKSDENHSSKCVSCGLCETICPTSAIQIKKANLVNFPSSLTQGESPLHFYLNTEKCIRCSLCVNVCQVDALSLDGKFFSKKVDLVKDL